MSDIKISDAAKALAEEHDIDITTVTGTGANGAITKGDIEKLVPENGDGGGDDDQGIVVKDVEVIVPKELPLIIEAPKGGWPNEAQAAFAKILNAYAYKNPAKWNVKKDGLIDQLKQLKDQPQLLAKFQGSQVEGVEGAVTFKSQDAPQGVDQE